MTTTTATPSPPIQVVFDVDYNSIDSAVFEEAFIESLVADHGVNRNDIVSVTVRPGSVIVEVVMRTQAQRGTLVESLASGIVVEVGGEQISGELAVCVDDATCATQDQSICDEFAYVCPVLCELCDGGTTTTAQTDSGDDLSTDAIVGIALGSAFAVLALVFGGACCLMRYKKRQSSIGLLYDNKPWI